MNTHPNRDRKGDLYIVGTPIGNLEDISFRAARILSEVEFIACEDTRQTLKLLNHLGIKTRLLSLHQHSSDSAIQNITRQLENGHSIAYVCDSGTPTIADPGGRLVHEARSGGIRVIPIPGPSAITTLLSVSGFPADSFTFIGFPPHKKGRQTFFRTIPSKGPAIVLFESKHRIRKTFQDLMNVLPGKTKIVVGRELSKMFEEIFFGTLEEVKEKIHEKTPLGEYTIVLLLQQKR